MNKILLIILSINFCILLTSCSSQIESNEKDNYYEKGYESGYSYGYFDGYTDCENEYNKYLSSENIDDYNPQKFCAFCGEEFLEDLLIEVNIRNDNYYFCACCITSYFKNIEEMKPCYYCIHCGELTSVNTYIHSWTECYICENCIQNYQQCQQCLKYDNDIRNNVCGLCGNF